VHGVTFSLEASIGVAISGHHGDDATVLLQRADAAMYSAKNDHTGIAAFHRDLEVGGPERLALLNELRNAIADKALTVHYQPKVDLRTGVVVGVEALVRWDHPRLGLVMPTTFVELAERSSLIAPLTRFVLDEALAQSRAWSAAGHVLSVAVNISSRSLGDAEFAGMVLDALARSGVPARQLVLELTESAIMTDPLTASQVLHDLHRVGVQISIDDFGTGYSSLAYLQALPLDELKIDRSFVERLDDVSGNAIVQSIIGLARNLGLRVVAEGVETERARDVLHVLDCDVGQGYLWSRAVPAGDVSSWIAERGVRPDAAAVLTA
jgi:EAL domain-containing protein (putative c-di-GMP-specific phosphodiesterase class I)